MKNLLESLREIEIFSPNSKAKLPSRKDRRAKARKAIKVNHKK